MAVASSDHAIGARCGVGDRPHRNTLAPVCIMDERPGPVGSENRKKGRIAMDRLPCRRGMIRLFAMAQQQPTRQLRAVDVSVEAGVLAARIIGPTVEANRAAVIREKVKEAMDRHAGDLKYVVLDFGEVDFVNSSGVGVCMELANEARRHNATPIVYRPTDTVTDILKMVSADRLYRFVQTAEELATVFSE
jgi:anti-anti-sigma factor